MEMEGLDLGVSQYHRQRIIEEVLLSDYISVVLGESVTDTKIKCPKYDIRPGADFSAGLACW